jgi:hypothetical protein
MYESQLVAWTIGEGKTNESWANELVYPEPAAMRFAPRMVRPWDAVADPETAETVVVDPGRVHGLFKVSMVVAVPEASVVVDAGAKDDPVGPLNETGAAFTGTVPSFTCAFTWVVPDAVTCMLAVVTAIVRGWTEAAAKVGVAVIATMTGTLHAVPAITVRRLSARWGAPRSSLSAALTDVFFMWSPSVVRAPTGGFQRWRTARR